VKSQSHQRSFRSPSGKPSRRPTTGNPWWPNPPKNQKKSPPGSEETVAEGFFDPAALPLPAVVDWSGGYGHIKGVDMAFDPYGMMNIKPCLGCHRPIRCDGFPSVMDPAGALPHPNHIRDFCSECERIAALVTGEVKKKPLPALPHETRTEPLIGLRVWKLARENDVLYLRSASQSAVWPHRKPLQIDITANEGVHAIKRELDKNKPSEDGGPWAMPGSAFSMFELTTTVEGLFAEYSADVAGEVYLWGKVVEHEIGYLAEFSYPKRLFVGENVDVLTWMQLEENYGVPVETDKRFTRPSTVIDPETGSVLTASQIRRAVNALQQASGWKSAGNIIAPATPQVRSNHTIHQSSNGQRILIDHRTGKHTIIP